jgi:hypothetical protein
MGACEYLPLATKQRVCWLRLVDECSGAFLHATVFAVPRWEHVDRRQVQEALRACFGRRGLPARLRVDNGYPRGNSGGWPPELALWSLGLGIDMAWIQPACPQQNGVVERAQDTGQDWCEAHTCRDAAQLQQRCTLLDQRQRERYPYRQGRSRSEVYPALRHSGRPYQARRERQHRQARRVYDTLALRVVPRQVDRTGCVSLYSRGRYVGKRYIGQQVYVSLDPTGPTWVMANTSGCQLRPHAAEELAAERIRSLTVTTREARDRQ